MPTIAPNNLGPRGEDESDPGADEPIADDPLHPKSDGGEMDDFRASERTPSTPRTSAWAPPTEAELSGKPDPWAAPPTEAELSAKPNSDHAAWVMHNAVATPEQGTIAADLAPAAARAPGYVLQHLPGVQLEQNQQQSADDLARAPTLAGVAGQSVAHATMMKDDTSVLADLTNAIVGDWTIPEDQQLAFAHGAGGDLTYISPVWLRKLGEGMREWRANNLTNFNTIFGSPRTGLGPKSVKEEAALTAPATDDQPEDKGSVSQAVGSAAGMVPYMAGAIGAGVVGEALGGKPGKVVALAGYNLWETLGPAVRSLRAAQNPDGSPTYSDAEVRNLALLSAAGQTAAMTAVEVATNSVFGAPLVRGEVNAAATQWLNSGGAALIKGFAARYSFHAAMGAFVMAAQHSIHAATEEFGKDWNFQAHDYSRPFTEFFPAFKQGLETMILPAAISPTMDVMGRHPLPAKPTPEQMEAVGQRANTQQEQAKLETLISGAEASKLGKRSPAQLQAALAPATEQQGASDTAFIDKEAFDKKHGPLAQQVATEQGGNYPEAHALNAPVTIPLEAHLANVADGSARELMPDTKLTPLGKTPNEIATETQPTLEEMLGLKAKAEGKEPLSAKDVAESGPPLPDEPITEEVAESGPPLPDEPITLGEADRLPDKSPIQEAREAIRAQVDAEAEADPAGRALKILQDDGGAGQKLDRQYINDNMDKKTAAALDALGVLKHNQMQPSDLANQLGFANAHELAHAILNPDLSEQGRQVETERRLLAQFPDANKTPAELKLAQVTVELRKLQEELANTQSRLKVAGAADLAAAQAAHARAIEALKGEQERIVSELTGDRKQTKDLTQGALRPGEDDLKAVKADAEAGVNAKALGDIDPNYYLAAERAAANRAQEAAAKGDIQGAVDAKRQQIASMFAGRFARDTKAELGKTRAELDSAYTPEGRAQLGLAGHSYQDGMDIAMEAIGLKRGTDPQSENNWWAQDQDSARAAAIAGTFQRMFADGYPSPDVPQPLRDLVNPPAGGKFRDWSKLTPQEAREVSDAIRGIRRQARYVTDAITEGEKLGLREAVVTTVDQTSHLPSAEPSKYSSGNPKPWYVFASEFLAGFGASLLEFKTHTERLGAMAHELLFNRMIAQQKVKNDLAAIHLPFFDNLIKNLPKEVAARAQEPTDVSAQFPMPEGWEQLTRVPRTYLWMLYQHRMSEGNIDRFLGGVTTLLDPAATRAAQAANPQADPVYVKEPWKVEDVDHLLFKNPATRITRAEADMLQSATDHLSKGTSKNPSLWDLTKQTQFDRFGISPPKVAGVPRTIQFADGTSKFYEGGYHPLSEDRVGGPPDNTVPHTPQEFWSRMYQIAATTNSSAKERIEGARYMTNMTWDSLPNHVSQVIHDLAFGDWVKNAATYVLDPQMKLTMDRVLGTDQANAVLRQIKTIAQGQSNTVITAAEKIWKSIDYTRKAAVTTITGYAAPFAAMQVFSHVVGMLAGGKVSLVHGIPELIKLTAGLRPGMPEKFGGDGLVRNPAVEQAFAESGVLQNREKNNSQIFGDAREILRARQGAGKLLVPFDQYKKYGGVFLHAADAYLSAWIYNSIKAEAMSGKSPMSEADAIQHAGSQVQNLLPDHSPETVAPILADRKLTAASLIMYGFGNKMLNEGWRTVVRPGMDAIRSGDGAGIARAGIRAIQYHAMLTTLAVVGKLCSGGGPEKGEDWGAWLARTSLGAEGMILPYLGGASEHGSAAIIHKLWGAGSVPANKIHYSVFQAPGAMLTQHIAQLADHLTDSKTALSQKALDALGVIFQLLNAPSKPVTQQASYLNDWRLGSVRPRGAGDATAGLVGYSTRADAPRNIPTIGQDMFSPPGTSQRRGK